MTISITLVIIVITCIVSFISFNNEATRDKLIFYPPAITDNNEWYRFFSCGFIHADIPHLMFNMYALYIFGQGQLNNGVEFTFIEIFGDKGRFLYLLMYVLALAVCLIPSYAKNKHNHYYRSLGASGAVSAVVFASMLFYPMNGMGLIFIPRLYIRSFLFGIIYLAVSYWLDKSGKGNINHSAHIWGGLFGFVFVYITCTTIAHFPVFENFVNDIKNLRLNELIMFR